MLTTLISRLEHFTALTDQDKGWLNGLVTRFDEFPAGRDIRRQAEVSDGIFVVTAGHACSYKILPDGGRQILEFIFRGDHAELPLEATDDGILALNHTAIAWINHHRSSASWRIIPVSRPPGAACASEIGYSSRADHASWLSGRVRAYGTSLFASCSSVSA